MRNSGTKVERREGARDVNPNVKFLMIKRTPFKQSSKKSRTKTVQVGYRWFNRITHKTISSKWRINEKDRNKWTDDYF